MKRTMMIVMLFVASPAIAGDLSPHQNDLEMLAQQNAVMTRNVALGNAAYQCGLRSIGWANSFSDAFSIWMTRETQRLGLSQKEANDLKANSMVVYKRTIAETSCSSLSELQTLRALDESRESLTLGYK